MIAVQSASPTADDILTDPAASDWLKSSLQSAVARDPVDALNDALVLAAALEDRLRHVLGLFEPN
jgi:hypothetical protein